MLVLGAYLVGTVAIGLWIGRGQRDLSSYLLGDRDLPWWAILLSIVATETSTATFLSVPGLAFAAGGDIRFLQLALGYIIGRLLIVLILLPRYFEGQLFTAYEVLEKRFGGATKKAASVIFLITRNLGDGLRLFLTAIVVEQMTGLSLPVSVLIMGAVTIVYTLFGGMKSVVWNDCIQFVIYIAGGIVAAAIILFMRLPGGWEQFSAFVVQQDKLRLFDLSFNLQEPFTLWAGLLGGMLLSLGTHGTDQMMVQRYLCARSRRDAALALGLSGVVVFVQFVLFLVIGMLLACFYTEVHPQTFTKSDEVFAVFIVNELPAKVGLIGLLLAAVLAAAMSTLSSSLNSSAASAVNDLYLSATRTPPAQSQLLKLSRWLTVVFGLIQIALGIAARYVPGTVVANALALAGFSAGLLLGLFFLGTFTRVTQRSALRGVLGGLAVLLAIKFFTPLAWTWYAVAGTLATFGIGLADHRLIREKSQS